MLGWFKTGLLAPLFALLLSTHGQALSGQAGGLNAHLKSILYRVENHFHRPLSVTSGCRSRQHNHRIGGARESWHLRCMAADFKVDGVNKFTLAHFAASLGDRGGIGTYCSDGSVHVDLGPRREWYWCGGHRNFHQGSIRRVSAFRVYAIKHRHHHQRFKYRFRRHHARHHRRH
jgi:Peptidase M15